MSERIHSLDDFLLLLKDVKQSKDGQYEALCPGHNDKNRSLSVKQADDKLLVQCFAGCNTANILKALNLEFKDLFLNSDKSKSNESTHRIIEVIYHYDGFDVVRTKPKGFYQRRPDGKGGFINDTKGVTLSLYHQDELSQAIATSKPIFVAEGEKDVENLRKAGFVATCNAMGAGKWRDSYSEALIGADVVIIPDNDEPGHDHASQVARSCYGKANKIRVLELPTNVKDISDWLIGHTAQELIQLARQCPEYQPPIEEPCFELDNTRYCQRSDPPGIYSITEGGRDGDIHISKTLTSFSIEPIARITVEGEGERMQAILKTKEAQHKCSFTRQAWNSKKQFSAELPSVDLQYFGTDKDLQAILALLDSYKLPEVSGTKVLGRHGDLWVLPEAVFSTEGQVNNPNIVYIPSDLDLESKVHYPTIEDEITLIRRVILLLLQLNEPKVIFAVLGWFFSTPFVTEIRRRLRHFPLLTVWGTHGAGKSSLLSLLWLLFGVESELISSTETHFSFLRILSATNTIPIIIDEFKPFNMKDDQTKLLVRFMKIIFDGAVEHRGRQNLSLVPYRLQTPTVIAGEVSPTTSETALVDRIIQVNLNPDARIANPTYKKAFDELSALELRAFALPYIRWCLGANLDDLFTEARALLPPTTLNLPSRVQDNILVMVTGLVALKRFAAQYGVELDQKTFMEGIQNSIEGLISELFERGQHDEIGLTIFLENLATLAQTQRIKHGMHYTTNDENTRLYIHLADCLAEFRKFARETNSQSEILDDRAYRTQAREVFNRKGYVLATNCSRWFSFSKTDGGSRTGKTRRCIEIDMEKLTFDTSGFEKME